VGFESSYYVRVWISNTIYLIKIIGENTIFLVGTLRGWKEFNYNFCQPTNALIDLQGDTSVEEGQFIC
jgi:hypothetical protein